MNVALASHGHQNVGLIALMVSAAPSRAAYIFSIDWMKRIGCYCHYSYSKLPGEALLFCAALKKIVAPCTISGMSKTSGKLTGPD
jgi:hypothetical protein